MHDSPVFPATQPGRYSMNVRLKAALLALLPLLLLTPPLLWLGRDFARRLAGEQRSRVQHTLELRTDALQGSLNRIEGKLESLADFVAARTAGGRDIDEEQFRIFAAGLHASATWVRAFQIVTDGVITQTYPRTGNEAVIGYNLLGDPRPVIGGDVVRAMQTGRVTITGPLDLVQGGLGLIMRQPLPRAPGRPARLVAVVFNIAPLLADAGINAGERDEVAFALRRDPGDVFYGPAAVFAQQPVTRRLRLPDGGWEMGACPRLGWAASLGGPVLRFYLAGAAIVLLLCLLVYVLAASRGLLRVTVRERTEALRRELAAREQAEEELRQNLALLQAVTEGTSDAVFVKDRDGRYQMINSAGAAFLNRTPAAIIGRTDAELFADESAAAILAQDRQVMASGRVQTFEDAATGGGVTRIYQATKAPWRDQHGAVIGIIGVSRDITGRKQMEEALRASEGQLSLILNNVSDVIFAVAVEPGEVFRFTSVNRRFLEATGLAEKQIVGALAGDIIPEPGRTLALQKYREAIRTGRPVHWEEVSDYPAGRKSGHVTVVPVTDARGVCTQLVGMVHDITARMRAEEEIRKLNDDLRRHMEVLEQRVAARTAELAVARDRAEAADRLKSAFLATMSHELRTPLNSIIGFSGILLQGLAGPLNPEQHKQLEMVAGSARHLLALINDVLDISKIEAGQLELRRQPFALRASLEKVADLVRPLAAQKGLALRLELAPAVDRLVNDQRRFEQVLLNLLNNAAKFTEHGEVRLSADLVAGDGRPPRLRVAVHDTGIGIKPEDQAKLFQPFRQVDTGLTRQHEGTGLGLAICQRLAALMGGEITVASEWGRGSVFTFTLPAGGPEAS